MQGDCSKKDAQVMLFSPKRASFDVSVGVQSSPGVDAGKQLTQALCVPLEGNNSPVGPRSCPHALQASPSC